MKKLLGLFLASAMLLSLNVPSFAAETHEITSSNYPACVSDVYHSCSIICWMSVI